MTASEAHILIADDEETFRLSTAALLTREGYTCDCVKDSDEALRLLPDDYDLLLADIRMPGNTELDFLRTVHHRMPDLPVVIVTGYPSLPTAVEALRLATVDYLIKPLDLDHLKVTVSRAVEKGRLRRALKAAVEDAGALTKTFQAIESAAEAGYLSDKTTAPVWAAERCLGNALAGIGRLSVLAGQLLAALKPASRETQALGRLDACHLLQCPRREAYETAIRETLEVIERTKRSFKSKELAALRLRLENLLLSHRGTAAS